MKQAALLLALAVLLLAGAAAFFVVGGEAPGSPAAQSGSPDAAASEPSPRPAELQAPLQGAEAEPARPATSAGELARVSPTDPGEQRRDATARRALAGQLVLPAGTPEDETVAIEAHRREPPAHDWAPPGPEDDPSLCAEATPGPDGGFELEVPDDLDRVWLRVRGRYLIARALEVELPAPEGLKLEPELGGWITGRLVLPQGAEIEEDETWSVRLEPDPIARMANANPFAMADFGGGPVRRRARVDPENALDFEFRGVRPSGGYTLMVRPDSLAGAKSEKFGVEPGVQRALELPLAVGGSLAGRVVDASGNGVPEVDIEVVLDPFMFGQGGFEVREGESDADGRFLLEHVHAGQLTLRLEAHGYIDGSTTVELAPGERREGLELTIDQGSSLAGRLTWPDGTAASGFDVDVEFDPSFLGGMEAMNAMRGRDGEDETDAEGRFLVTGLGKGPFVVRAEAERAPSGSEDDDDEPVTWVARKNAVRPDGTELALVLEPPVGVAGRVVNDLGEPVERFTVQARTKTSGLLAGVGAENTTGEFEADDGRFFLEGLRPGEWEAFASAEGHGRAEPLPLSVPQLEGAELVLTLDRAATVVGKVVDPSGQPVAGAKVAPKVTLGDIGRIALEQASGTHLEAETLDDGSFELGGLPTGALELVASHAELAQSLPAPVELVPAERLEGLVLELRTGGRILGVVYDDAGDPWPGQTILVQDPTLSSGQKFGSSDGAGEFLFEGLAPGSYQVMTFGSQAPNNAPEDDNDFAAMLGGLKFTMAQVEDGEDTWVELGAVPANPVHLAGRVLAAGDPVGGAMVSLFSDGGEGMEGLKFTTTNSDGRFETELNAPGRYLISVQQVIGTGQQQSVEFLRDVPEVEEHELELVLPVGTVAGRVRGPGGTPVANARVSLAADGPIANGSFTGGNYAEIWTDADGRYELRWLRPGRYSVAAGGAFLGGLFGDTGDTTYGRQVQRITLGEDEELDNVDFRLETPGSITGRVTDLGGRPVAEAAIFLRDEDGNPIDRISMVVTDAAGHFEYSSLEPGSYQVQARSSDQVSNEPMTARVRSGQESEVELALDAGTLLVVSLSDREGNPVRCRVEVSDSEGNQVNGLWSFADLMQAFSSGGGFSSSEQRVGPLPPGKYRIEAIAEDGRDARKTVTLSGQDERPVRLRLD